MKKIILFALMLAASVSHAATVDINSAKTIASNFYSSNSNKSITSITAAYTETANNGTPAYYVFNINTNDGFVIVAADDAALPILGYATTGHYEAGNVAPNCAGMLNGYKQQIIFIKTKGIQSTPAIDMQWQSLKSNQSQARSVSGFSVAPMLTCTWNQSPYYNDSCPGGSVTGCVATAMAQIMKYWNFPAHGTGSHSYCDCTADGFTENYGTLSANFGNTTYDWAAMPLNVTLHNGPVAQLMYDCGVSVDMQYSPASSGAWVITADNPVCSQAAYVAYFGYNGSTIQGLRRSAYEDSAWTALIINELNNYRPVQYVGYGGAGGHTWVCDGYDNNNNFHMNWGWGGLDDGYYNLGSLNPQAGEIFNSQEEALIGIEPVYTCAPPIAAYSYIDSANTVTFTDSSSLSATRWHWNFGDGDTSDVQNPVHTYAQSSYYTVCLTAHDSCGSSTACRNVVVGTCPPPAVAFDYNINNGFTVLFTDYSYGASSWHWNFGDTDTSDIESPAYTYTKIGNYKVCLSASNQCGVDTSCTTIEVTCQSTPYAIFYAYDILSTVYFYDEGYYYGANDWLWDFGDGTSSNAQNPVHTYSQAGSYNVKETVWDACGYSNATSQLVYTTSCALSAGYYYIDSAAYIVSFFDTSSSGTVWHWDFGDGDTSNLRNPMHAYPSTGLAFYEVCLTVSDSCGSSIYCNGIIVGCYLAPAANFSYSDSAFKVSFFNSSSYAAGWQWNFGDSTVSNIENPVHTYSHAGIYTVTLTVEDPCGDSASVAYPMYIYTTTCAVKAAFGYSDSLYKFSFSDSSSAGVNSWVWVFGDGDTVNAQNPVHVYYYNSSYNVCLTASDSCGSNTICRWIYAGCIYPDPNLGYSDSLLKVYFFDYVDPSAVLWHWDFGDGDTNNTENPVHTYAEAGTYNITLTSYDACGDNSETSQVISIAACTTPSISARGAVLTSSAATGNQWYRSNIKLTGDTSQNYTVTENGSYTVEVAGSNNCTVMSAIYHYSSTGIAEPEISNYDLRIYPNPTKGVFELQITNDKLSVSGYQLSIYNVLGQQVYQSFVNSHSLTGSASVTINLSSQPAGVYLLRLQSGDGVVNEKIVKE